MAEFPQGGGPLSEDEREVHERRSRQGAAIEHLLEDETVAEVLSSMEERVVERWKRSPFGATEEREAAYRLYCGLVEFTGELREIVEAGRISQRALDQEPEGA